jgi:hypothetical protein
LAAHDVAERERQAAGSLVRKWFASSKEDTHSAWVRYADDIARRSKDGPWNDTAVRTLISRAPKLHGTPLLELKNLFQEQDPGRFAASLLRLAETYGREGSYPNLTFGLLQAAEAHPSTVSRAQALGRTLSGGGTAFQQLWHQGSHLLKDLASPLSLASFGCAVWSARVATAAIFARASSFTPLVWAAGETAALAVEVPALVLSRRLGMQIFTGGENLFSPESIAQELGATFGPFALLRGAGNAFAFLGAPALRRWGGLNGPDGELTRWGQVALGTARFGTEVLAVAGGHGLNTLFKVEGAAGSEHPWLTSVLTAAHMRVAGYVLDRFGLAGGVTERLAWDRARLVRQGIATLLKQGGIAPQSPLLARYHGEIQAAFRRGDVSPLTIDRWTRQSRRGQDGRVRYAMEARGLDLLSQAFGGSHRRGGDGHGFGLPGLMGFGPQTALAVSGNPVSRVLRGLGGNEFFANGSRNDLPNESTERDSTPPESGPGAFRALLHLAKAKLGHYFRESQDYRSVSTALEAVYGLWGDFAAHPEAVVGNRAYGSRLAEVDQILTEAEGNLSRLAGLLEAARTAKDRAKTLVESWRPAQGAAEPPAPDAPPAVSARSRGSSLADVVVRGLVYLRDALVLRKVQDKPAAEGRPGSDPLASRSPAEEVGSIDSDVEQLSLSEISVRQRLRTARELFQQMQSVHQRGLRPDSQQTIERLIDVLNEQWRGVLWRSLGAKGLETERVERQDGAVLGLAAGRHWLGLDTTQVVGELMGVEAPSSGINVPLELLHQAILRASKAGDAASLEHFLDALVRGEPEIHAGQWNPEKTRHAVLLMGRAIQELVRGEGNPQQVVNRLVEQAQSTPMETLMGNLGVTLKHGSTHIDLGRNILDLAFEGFSSGDRGPEAGFYLTTGLSTLLLSGGDLGKFQTFMSQGESLDVATRWAWHPSVAASLFGAAYGAKRLPDGLFPSDFIKPQFIATARWLVPRD